MSDLSFEALPLAAPIQLALREKNYTTPSPIQAQAIPLLLEGRDLLGCAQTGTGKTAAFSLPILHRICEDPRPTRRRQARALVLVPTRELAVQVHDSFKAYGARIRFRSAMVFGGVSQVPQVRAMERGVDVLVATPGRLLDLMEQGYLDLGGVEFFVLDEVDRMLDMGFIHDVRKIVSKLPIQRQSLFFSATLATEVSQLAQTILRNPARVSVAPDVPTAERVTHKVCFLEKANKDKLLQQYLRDQDRADGRNLTLVFSRTKHGADKLVKILDRSGIRSEAIHGNKSQGARQRALDAFRSGRIPVLVATDVAARGIDVKDVTLVINYDVPNEAESYVHRIGRTARAGAEGLALTFCSGEELNDLGDIERLIKQTIEVHSEHPFHADSLEERHRNRGRRTGGGGGGFRGKHSRGATASGARSGGNRRRRSRGGPRAARA